MPVELKSVVYAATVGVPEVYDKLPRLAQKYTVPNDVLSINTCVPGIALDTLLTLRLNAEAVNGAICNPNR